MRSPTLLLASLALTALAACGGSDAEQVDPAASSASSGSGGAGGSGDATGGAGGALDDTDAFIEARLSAAHIPGLSACIIKHGAVAWCKAYGMADIEAARPVTTDTVFMIASISKTITAAALMQLEENGDLGLDDPVAQAVDFSIEHPTSDVPITYRMLLTHTSSLRDNWDMLDQFYDYEVDPTKTLKEVVSGYLDPAGSYYDADLNFLPEAPGTTSEYADMGFATLGYLVEARTGTRFSDYTQEHILAPLGMSRTSWWLADFAPEDLVTPYGWDGESYTSYGQYSFADYPDGGLRTTAPALARFLAAISAGGQIDGARILEEGTVAQMLELQVPDIDETQGLAFYHIDFLGDDWVGHNGGESGVATDMYFRPADGLGFVVLMNGDWEDDTTPIDEIEEKLVQVGESLP